MPIQKAIALVDCNNFYASCERAFDRKLIDAPVVVLSNNDGCAIARSNEAKALGIGMAEPYFKFKHIVQQHDVQVLSSNFALYGDMSRRVHQTLCQFSPEVEIYSIDEMFLDLTGSPDIDRLGVDIRQTVLKHTAIPTCVGIAPTKTLAKLANVAAKKDPAFKYTGVCNLMDEAIREAVLQCFPVEDIWGVGRKTATKMHRYHLYTAADLLSADQQLTKRLGSVMLERLITELRGIPCHALDINPDPQKGVAATRSFGRPVYDLAELQEAIAMHATRVAEKLRKQNLETYNIRVFCYSNKNKPEQPQHYGWKSMDLLTSTADTRTLVATAKQLIEQAYRKGIAYKKCGVILTDLVPAGGKQLSFFESGEDQEKSHKLMQTMDAINQKYGRMTLRSAAVGFEHKWQMRSNMRSPRYTTVLEEVPVVRAQANNT